MAMGNPEGSLLLSHLGPQTCYWWRSNYHQTVWKFDTNGTHLYLFQTLRGGEERRRGEHRGEGRWAAACYWTR